MRRLTKEGLLVSQGAGRRRRIRLSEGRSRARTLRVLVLLYEDSDKKRDYLVELIHRLHDVGHAATFATKTMRDLGMDLNRIVRYVSAEDADAWIVEAGPRDVLEWFSRHAIPAFALFGRSRELPLASIAPKKAEVYAEVVDRLIGMGHRRIVSLVREDRRKPIPAFVDRIFLEQLSNHGIQTGAYNLPDWEDSPEGLRSLLDSLFRHSPPTAMLLDEPALFFAARDHLARKGIFAPEHVSMVCCDYDPIFEWCRPTIAHIAWDPQPMIRRVVKWSENISRGKDDRRKSASKAWLVKGGTIGPVPVS